MNADGSGLTRLTDHPSNGAPSWSGDGRQIYFLSSNRDGRTGTGLYAMKPDGTGVYLVVDAVNGPYAVSPDGTRIAFGAITPLQSPQNVDLFVMNVDGSGLRRVTDAPGEELAPDWNPAGP